MRTKTKNLTIFLVCFTMVIVGLAGYWGCTKEGSEGPEISAQEATERPMISDAERALAMCEVRNIASKILYYHSIGVHEPIIDELWAKHPPTPITWANQSGVWVGEDWVKYFVDYNNESRKQNLEAISKVAPGVENVPENLGVGSWIVHCQTTPVIEIAGDGKTAKMVLYSPGAMLSSRVQDGKLVSSGNWFFEKYAFDFIKEDGKWKIWHQHMYYDATPPLDGSWTEPEEPVQLELGEDEEKQKQLGGVPPTRPPIDTYTPWSPTRVPQMAPRLPEPYYTFSETFSYEYE